LKKIVLYLSFFFLSLLAINAAIAMENVPVEDKILLSIQSSDEEGFSDEIYEEDEEIKTYKGIPDPLEPINRVSFQFNDKLYFWLLRPMAKGYGTIVPLGVRKGIKNFIHNLAFPVRFINCILQGKFRGAADEITAFLVNSTVGVGGFVDVVSHSKTLKIRTHDEDLGQTLGRYGIGHGIYIVWPFLGPSSLRDTIGLIGDGFLDPKNYILKEFKENVGLRAYKEINDTSLRLGEYEDLKESALDPYISIRDAYYQYRKKEVSR